MRQVDGFLAGLMILIDVMELRSRQLWTSQATRLDKASFSAALVISMVLKSVLRGAAFDSQASTQPRRTRAETVSIITDKGQQR